MKLTFCLLLNILLGDNKCLLWIMGHIHDHMGPSQNPFSLVLCALNSKDVLFCLCSLNCTDVSPADKVNLAWYKARSMELLVRICLSDLLTIAPHEVPFLSIYLSINLSTYLSVCVCISIMNIYYRPYINIFFFFLYRRSVFLYCYHSFPFLDSQTVI